MSSPKYKITQTLLSAWIWAGRTDEGYENLLRALRREKTPLTPAMADGNKFEGMVNSILDGQIISGNMEWAEQAKATADMLLGSQKQVNIYRDIYIDGTPILLHGVLDFLRFGVIYDTKFSKTYHLNKYFESPQHPMYFELVPEAEKFQYIICDGKFIYRETYYREDTADIRHTIKQFLDYLKTYNLWDLYRENWRV